MNREDVIESLSTVTLSDKAKNLIKLSLKILGLSDKDLGAIFLDYEPEDLNKAFQQSGRARLKEANDKVFTSSFGVKDLRGILANGGAICKNFKIHNYFPIINHVPILTIKNKKNFSPENNNETDNLVDYVISSIERVIVEDEITNSFLRKVKRIDLDADNIELLFMLPLSSNNKLGNRWVFIDSELNSQGTPELSSLVVALLYILGLNLQKTDSKNKSKAIPDIVRSSLDLSKSISIGRNEIKSFYCSQNSIEKNKFLNFPLYQYKIPNDLITRIAFMGAGKYKFIPFGLNYSKSWEGCRLFKWDVPQTPRAYDLLIEKLPILWATTSGIFFKIELPSNIKSNEKLKREALKVIAPKEWISFLRHEGNIDIYLNTKKGFMTRQGKEPADQMTNAFTYTEAVKFKDMRKKILDDN